MILHLNLKLHIYILADSVVKYFVNISKIIRLNISCELETIHSKYQGLVFLKEKKKISEIRY